jgi:hypothetical protein
MQEITIFTVGFVVGFFMYLFATIVALLYFSHGINEDADFNDDFNYYSDDVL